MICALVPGCAWGTATQAPSACAYLKPGANPKPGEGGISCPRLGSSVFTLPLDDSQPLPVLGKDASGNTVVALMETPRNGAIVLVAEPHDPGVAAPGTGPDQAVGDVVAVADFKPIGAPDARFGIVLRCTKAGCITVAVDPKGTFDMGDYGGNTKPTSNVIRGAARVPTAKVSRLVVEAKGATVEAWFNGEPLGRFSTGITAPGVVAFLDADLDAMPAEVTLSRLVGFVAT